MNVLITGGTKGIGAALAKRFEQGGHRVIRHGRTEGDVSGNLEDDETINALVDAVEEYDVDVLVNNAGELCTGMPFNVLPHAILKRTLISNFFAPLMLTRDVYAYMAHRGHGVIVNVCSAVVHAQPKEGYNTPRTAYKATKAGLSAFGEALAQEGASRGVVCLNVYPGKVKTRPDVLYGETPEEAAESIYDAVTKCEPVKAEGARYGTRHGKGRVPPEHY